MAKHAKRPNLDSVTTINTDGSHYALHPADVEGRFTSFRRVFALLLVALYVALPWIPINGKPAVFLNVAERQFHLLGITFLAQDLWLGFFVVTGLGFSLFYLTSLAGRLWCGWACPYTVFLEHVFRRLERLIEGDAQARRRLDAAAWDGRKIARRGGKHVLFVLLSAVIAHLFLAYFVSIPELYQFMRQSPLEHIGSFAVVVGLTVVLYFCFSWFREQFCIIMCPYGRIQSALSDDQTMVIGYDDRRGEPRGKAKAEGSGDCIDCRRCVQVCPTGIDIREGLQVECIGCAACIDACNDIMVKVGKPTGLVRYDSHAGLSGLARKVIRPRILLYTVLLLAGAGAMVFSLSKVKPFFFSVTRMKGAPYYVTEDSVRNQFQIRLVNKRNQEVGYEVVAEVPDSVRVNGFEVPVELEARGEVLRTFTVTVPRESYEGKFDLELTVRGGISGAELSRTVYFNGPDPRLLEDFDAK